MTQTGPEDIALRHEALPDEELLSAVRAGDTGAYAVLYRRHLEAARALARRLAGAHEGQDVAQEAFLKVLRAIVRGGGPRDGFAPYLMRAVRNEAVDRVRRSREAAVEDMEEVESARAIGLAAGVEQADRELVGRAFSTLPPQWQRILWLTEVEGLAPREVAPQLRRSPSAVAQLSRRAREGLRSAWLQAHLDGTSTGPGCRQTADVLGGYERGQLSTASAERARGHLLGCGRCSGALRDLQALSARMRGALLPVVLGSPILLEELRELLLPAGQQLGLDVLGRTGGGASHRLSSRLSVAGLGAPVAAAGVLLLGAAGLALLALGPGSDREALAPALEGVEPDAVDAAPRGAEDGAVSLDAEGPAETTAPTDAPMLVEQGTSDGEVPAADSDEAGRDAPTTGDGSETPGAPTSTVPGPAPRLDPSPAVEVPPAGPGTPAGQSTPAPDSAPEPVDPPASVDPPAVADPSAPVGNPPAPGGSSPTDSTDDPADKPKAPDVPDPPMLGEPGATPPAPYPPQPPEGSSPPSDEPAAEPAP